MPTSDHHDQEKGEEHLLDGIHYTGKKGPCFGTRHTMIVLIALGTTFSSLTKTIFSTSLLAMTSRESTPNLDIPVYDWKKGVILSSVSWLGIPIQLIAGHWGKQYGHKWLILGSSIVNAIFFMLIPLFASFGGAVGVIFCRVVEGIAIGVLTPVSAGINGIWVPAEERAKAGMIGLGLTLIISMVSYVVAGQIIGSSLGYPATFYIIGGLILTWCVFWYLLAFQGPSAHPRISPEERKYIEVSLSLRKSENIPTPWIKFFTSMHFWAPIVASIGTAYVDALLQNVNIVFVSKAWNIDIKTSTTTIGVAPIAGIAAGVIFAPFSDYLIKRKILRVVNARRLFHTVGTIGLSAVLIWMTFIEGDNTPLVILNLCLANILTVIFSIGGSALNILDIAPAFAGIISGFSSTVSQSVSLFAPLTLDWIVTTEADKSQWRTLFFISGGIVVASTLFFDIFASDKRVWDIKKDEEEEEHVSDKTC